MKLIKRYRLLEVGSFNTDGDNYLDLKIVNGIYCFYDSEEEAIKAAYEHNEYRDYAIIPIYSFDND